MSHLYPSARWTVWWISAVLVILGIVSCGRHGESDDEAQVRKTFESWQNAMVDSHVDQSMAYIPQNVYDYFHILNSAIKAPAANDPLQSTLRGFPGVDLLLRTALEKKVPGSLRPNLTLNGLVQLAADKRLFKPRDIRQITLGYIAINGNHASADIYYQGTLTALRMPFLREDKQWKIDVLAILPYVEVLMRVDRAIKGETEDQQVNRLVGAMPLL